MKVFKILLFSLLIFCASAGFVHGQTILDRAGDVIHALDSAVRKIEISYPPLPFPGGTIAPPQDFINGPSREVFPRFLNYIYHFIIALSSLIIFVLIIIGAVRYILSLGNPSKMNEARNQVYDAVIGVAIILSSYLIVTTINPQLRSFNVDLPQVEDCDCSGTSAATLQAQAAGLSDYCKAICNAKHPLPTPSPSPNTFFQVPVGKLIENAYLNTVGQAKVAKAKESVIETERLSKVLRDKSEELKLVTDACTCGLTKCKDTSQGCTGDSCPYATCDTAKIQQLVAEINSAISDLETVRAKREEVRQALEKDFLEFEKAGMLTSLPSGIMDYDRFLLIKYEHILFNQPLVIDTFYDTIAGIDWRNIEIESGGRTVNDPVTFYFEKEPNLAAIEQAESLTGDKECKSPDLPPPSPPPSPPPPSPPPGGWQFPIRSRTILSSNAADHLRRGSVRAWDLTAPCGTDIYPSKDGTVEIASCGNEGGYGCWVQINHGDGWTTRYCHMIRGSISVSNGASVTTNTRLGRVGCTGMTSFGPHTHFEILQNRRQVDPATVFGNPSSIGLQYIPFLKNLACPSCQAPW